MRHQPQQCRKCRGAAKGFTHPRKDEGLVSYMGVMPAARAAHAAARVAATSTPPVSRTHLLLVLAVHVLLVNGGCGVVEQLGAVQQHRGGRSHTQAAATGLQEVDTSAARCREPASEAESLPTTV